MRRHVFALLLVIASATAAQAASVAFVSPVEGMQAVGAMPIEITTDVASIDRVEFYVDGNLAGVARRAPYRIAFDFGTSLMPRKVTAKVFSNGFRNTTEVSVTTAAVTASDSINVDVVEIPLRIRASRPVKAQELRVRENLVEQEVRELRQDRGAAQFVFVIDRSLSMRDGRLTEALRAIDAETRALRADDSVSVILFNHNVATPRAISRGEQLARVFADIPPSGGTSMRDAVSAIPRGKRTYAFVITDGGDRNSMLNDEEALRRISGTKTVLHALVVGDSHARFLDRAAANTGGVVVRASAPTLARELRRLIADINSRYTLVYQSSGTKNGWRVIDVSARRGNMEIANARKGYFAE